MKKEDVSFCSEVVKVAGEGMPRRGGKGAGDLYVTLLINFPRRLTEQQKNIVRQAKLSPAAQ